jgi:hypothetical protein
MADFEVTIKTQQSASYVKISVKLLKAKRERPRLPLWSV